MRACYACGTELPEKLEVHRTTECPACRRDLHVCRNCAFYSPGSHWDCAETVPEGVSALISAFFGEMGLLLEERRAEAEWEDDE